METSVARRCVLWNLGSDVRPGARSHCVTTPNAVIHGGLSTGLRQGHPSFAASEESRDSWHPQKKKEMTILFLFLFSMAGHVMWNLCVGTEIAADAFISAQEPVP